MTTNTEENGMTTEDWSFYDEGYFQDAKGEDLLGDLKAIAEAPAASAYVLEAMDCSWLVLGPAGATEEQAQTALQQEDGEADSGTEAASRAHGANPSEVRR